MYRYKKLLVVLSLTDNDQSLIAYAHSIAHLARSESVHFLYSREPVEIPANLKKQYPWMVKPIASAAQERVEALVNQHFSELTHCKIDIQIAEKQPALASLEKVIEADIDLVLVGVDEDERHTAIKLARKAPCSVLIAPTAASGEITNICLGIDTSRFSEYVLDVGTAFASAKGKNSVECINYFKIPVGHHKATLPREHFEEDLKKHSESKMEAFLTKQNLRGVTANITTKESNYPGGELHKDATDKNCDLIIIGCRGKDALTASLLGSNAEDTIQSSTKCAVLAVKEKGTGLSFLQALLGLKSTGSLF